MPIAANDPTKTRLCSSSWCSDDSLCSCNVSFLALTPLIFTGFTIPAFFDTCLIFTGFTIPAFLIHA